MRKIKPSDLVGKTIIDVECEAINCMTLSFDDESELQIWCEPGVSTVAGDIWGFFVEGDGDDEDGQDEDE